MSRLADNIFSMRIVNKSRICVSHLITNVICAFKSNFVIRIKRHLMNIVDINLNLTPIYGLIMSYIHFRPLIVDCSIKCNIFDNNNNNVVWERIK